MAEGFAIDQHYMKNPDELYNQVPDDLLVDLENKFILEGKSVVVILFFTAVDNEKLICSARHMKCLCH